MKNKFLAASLALLFYLIYGDNLKAGALNEFEKELQMLEARELLKEDQQMNQAEALTNQSLEENEIKDNVSIKSSALIKPELPKIEEARPAEMNQIKNHRVRSR